MNYEQSKLIIYNGDNVHFLTGNEILDNFNCTLISTTDEYFKYELNETILINSLTKTNKNQLSKILYIYLKKDKEELYEFFLNNNTNYLSNVLCFNLKQQKQFFIKNIDNIEKKFLLQNLNKFVTQEINTIENINLTLDNGFLVGYWLLRGGFQQVKKNDIEHPSWSGKEEHIELLKSLLKNETYLVKSFKNDLNSILLINEEYTDFFKFYFKQNVNKNFPLWIYSSTAEFIQGLFYGLISANSYISIDSNGNYYLTIKIINPNLIFNINQLLEYRLNVYSKVIGKSNYLSLKINSRLYELLLFGVEEKYINIDNFDKIDPVVNKEIKYETFRLLPWYKCKIQKIFVDNAFALELDNNNIHMIANGLFTS